jgi:hypothetical protein
MLLLEEDIRFRKLKNLQKQFQILEFQKITILLFTMIKTDQTLLQELGGC